MSTPETIEGKKTLLRPITRDDTDNIVRWRNSDNTLRYFLERTPITAESHLKWLADNVESGRTRQYIIIDRASLTDVGSCFLKDIDLKNKKSEFGIFIGESSARGKGLGTDAAATLLKSAFSDIGLNKVFLRVLSDNARAVASYEKAGFKTDGKLREDYFDGTEYRDIVIMSALKKEFEGGSGR